MWIYFFTFGMKKKIIKKKDVRKLDLNVEAKESGKNRLWINVTTQKSVCNFISCEFTARRSSQSIFCISLAILFAEHKKWANFSVCRHLWVADDDRPTDQCVNVSNPSCDWNWEVSRRMSVYLCGKQTSACISCVRVLRSNHKLIEIVRRLGV